MRISNVVASVFSSNAVLTVTLPTRFSSASISSNQIQLVLTGQPGRSISIESSSNLVDWVQITNTVLTNGIFEFSDAFTNHQRFYRTVEP